MLKGVKDQNVQKKLIEMDAKLTNMIVETAKLRK